MTKKTGKYRVLRTLLTCLALILATSQSSARTVHVATPGTLGTLVTAADGDRQLTVTGTVDASDLFFIADKLTSLQSLDLQHVHIAAYNGATLNGRVCYEANTLPSMVFAGCTLTTVQLPAIDSLTIADAAFAGCALSQLVLPPKTHNIGTGAFAACTHLEKINFNNAPASLSDNAFSDCVALEKIEGADALTAIGNNSFRGCLMLTDFDFGNSLRNIGDGAFQGSRLTQVDMTRCTALHHIGDFAFANTPVQTVVLPAERTVEMGKGVFFDCAQLTDITLPGGLNELSDYLLKGATTAAHHGRLPEHLKRIGAYALKDNTSLTDITLPASLQKIGDGAMEGATALESIDGTALAAIPETGDDVWAGVDQATVVLKVKPEHATAFRSAAQWQEFRIDSTDGISGPEMPDDKTKANVKARFVGQVLYIIVPDEYTPQQICVYDYNGRLLAALKSPGNNIAVDTAQFSNSYYIINISLNDGLNAVIKIAR